MGLSVYLYNSAFLVKQKSSPPKKTCHPASATLFPQLEHTGLDCGPRQEPREEDSLFLSNMNNDVTESEEKWKAFHAKLSLNMNSPRSQTFCLRRAWGFLCRWHDNLSANGTARPIVSLIVCLRPSHAAAGMCNLGSNFGQIACWTRQRGASDRLIPSVGHMENEGSSVKLIRIWLYPCQIVPAVNCLCCMILEFLMHLNSEQKHWFIHIQRGFMCSWYFDPMF